MAMVLRNYMHIHNAVNNLKDQTLDQVKQKEKGHSDVEIKVHSNHPTCSACMPPAYIERCQYLVVQGNGDTEVNGTSQELHFTVSIMWEEGDCKKCGMCKEQRNNRRKNKFDLSSYWTVYHLIATIHKSVFHIRSPFLQIFFLLLFLRITNIVFVINFLLVMEVIISFFVELEPSFSAVMLIRVIMHRNSKYNNTGVFPNENSRVGTSPYSLRTHLG